VATWENLSGISEDEIKGKFKLFDAASASSQPLI
jgi:hypothetical protein